MAVAFTFTPKTQKEIEIRLLYLFNPIWEKNLGRAGWRKRRSLLAHMPDVL
jgi:hypothetical protein